MPTAILTILLILACCNARAMSRMAEATVKSAGGVPCFTISEQEEKRNGTPLLEALMVSDLSVQPPKKIWSFSFGGERTLPIHSNGCVAYGKIPQEASGTMALPLVNGRVYSVFLNGRPDDPSDPTYGYKAKFCITKTPTGMQQIIQLLPDSAAWQQQLCPTAATAHHEK